MTTQAQGKGKKKNKEVMKISLDEFNQQIDAPHGHSVVSLKMTGLDWAETMADYDQQSTEIQQIVVPTAPKAHRGPNIDLDSLPSEPPFRVSLFNAPMSAEERDIERFFNELHVVSIDVNAKSSTTVEFESKNDLYEALCKDGSNLKGRTVNVCVFGEQPQNNYGSDRYGGRGGNSSYNDRYGDRNQGGYGQRANDRYGDRSGGGFNRDRDNYGRGGYGQQRSGGYNDRYSDRSNFRDSNRGPYTSGGGEPESDDTNWRARPVVKPSPPPQSSYNNGSRQTYMHSRPEPPQHHNQPQPSHQQYHHEHNNYQRYQHNQPPNHQSYSQFNNQASSNDRPPASSSEERPKLVLSKRKTPINVDDVSSVSRNEAIFGKAKPSSKPYQKMNEIEEKLKAVQITDKKVVRTPSQAGSQTGSLPRSRRESSNHSESNS